MIALPEKSLSDLFDVVAPESDFDVKVCSLCSDSRKVTAGSLFFAVPGERHDGRDYLDQAVAAGAGVLVVDGAEFSIAKDAGVVTMVLPEAASRMAAIASRYFGNPANSLELIGVTGTNGKTTTSWFVAELLSKSGVKTGLIGTLGAGVFPDVEHTGYTTPDALTLQECLFNMLNQGVETVVMEVSSHAICQGRVAGIRFDQMMFTNLSHDHLDYHGDIESYAAVKKSIFFSKYAARAVVNVDDEYGQAIVDETDIALCSHVSMQKNTADWYISKLSYHTGGCQCTVVFNGNEYCFSIPVFGRFNVMNAVMALVAIVNKGSDLTNMLAFVSAMQMPPGRMERIAGEAAFAIVDFAHTPDALEKVLKALRKHIEGRLICVFGCGGDRDRTKRPAMGRIAALLSDIVVVTSDNPRSEDPERIMADICAGIPESCNLIVEVDRARAIVQALDVAVAGDVVLVAGKGHEDYQEVLGQKIPYSDTDVIKAQLLQIQGGQND